MTQSSFLDQIAAVLIDKYKDRLTDVKIVLPNKRARVFLIEAIKRLAVQNLFAPTIISIEDFVQDIAGVRSADSIELIFEFYAVYLKITEPAKQQSFEQFANWATTLLQDFNEIDRYLLEPAKVLSYLKDIEDIKHWSLDPEKRTDLIEKHLQFWELLPKYYDELYNHLLSKGIGYQGLIYREAVQNINHFTDSPSAHHYIFAGFNALNAAEEKIIQHLLASGNAEIYWDTERTFLEDSYHDAGLFARRFKQNWKHYKSHAYDWVFDEFSASKSIEIIGTPKSLGQAKIAGKIIENIIEDNPNTTLDKVAVVLGEETLLVPLLYSLPSTVGALNITMGYSAKNNPAQILVAKIFKMHTNALSRSKGSYVFYYKDVLDVLTHPLVEAYVNSATLVKTIKENNYAFIPHYRLLELSANTNSLFLLIFRKWEHGSAAALAVVSELLMTIKNNLSNDNEQDKIAKAFVYAVFKTINKLTTYYAKHEHIDNIETLHAIYKQVIDLAEVSFEGEPLNGLQVMGVLESRVLDFETVIVTSMNEGKFPAGKSMNSFIPYDVKRELGLPTFKEKDAIYTYHFYHLLQRAKKIYLIYNTESEGLDAGEKSRFITQLEVEKQQNHTISHNIYSAELPDTAYTPIVIQKSDSVMQRLQEIARDGFSPSALTSYIRNPIDFYFSKILRIREVDDVEENIALNTLGTIIHEVLRALYEPFIGKFLCETDIAQCRAKTDEEVMKQFRLVYKEGEIKKGRNLLAFEVAKRNVTNFLKMESEALRNDDIVKILFLEKRFERILQHPSLPFNVKIGGSVDRIEERNGIIRIIDYKTGKVEANQVVLKSWDKLTEDIKNDKIIQILAYAFMIAPEFPGRRFEAGIISFKNMKCGFLPFELIQDKVRTAIVGDEILDSYIDELAKLLNEIFNLEIPFTENIL